MRVVLLFVVLLPVLAFGVPSVTVATVFDTPTCTGDGITSYYGSGICFIPAQKKDYTSFTASCTKDSFSTTTFQTRNCTGKAETLSTPINQNRKECFNNEDGTSSVVSCLPPFTDSIQITLYTTSKKCTGNSVVTKYPIGQCFEEDPSEGFSSFTSSCNGTQFVTVTYSKSNCKGESAAIFQDLPVNTCEGLSARSSQYLRCVASSGAKATSFLFNLLGF